MTTAPWSDPLPLQGVPEGCVAHVRLVDDGAGGWRLPRDRSGRTRLNQISVSAAVPDPVQSPITTDPSLRRFVLATARRRWTTITESLGERAWDLAVRLCKAGDVDLIFRLDHPTKLGDPIAWRRAGRHDPIVAAMARRPKDTANEAREVLGSHAAESWVDQWLEGARRSGLLRRASNDQGDLVQRAARVVAAFPLLTSGPSVGVTELAARHGGPRGAHALDAGHRLTALVLRAAATLVDLPYPRTAAGRRALWTEVGVAPDRVSATVLVANLPAAGDHIVARQLRERAAANLPTHLCMLDLSGQSLVPPEPMDIYVCENPRVLEAAVASHVEATLVCVQGNATTTAITLLSGLVSAGCRLHYRGDFDWPGIAMANRIMTALKAQPWHFDRGVYSVAVRRHGVEDLVPLSGRPVLPAWDSALGEAMNSIGMAVHEELLIDDLVNLLSASP